MYAKLIYSLVAILIVLPASAQETDLVWQQLQGRAIAVPEQILVDHEQLRNVDTSAAITATKQRGSMYVEIRDGQITDANEFIPASIVVKYRSRVIAAATGYRLGSALTENGIVIESWAGTDNCAFTRWRLEFRGERLEVIATEKFRAPHCAN